VPGAVVDSLRPGVQQRIRRSITGLGQVEGEWATSVDAGLEIFCELVGLHEERWRKAGQPGAFATTRIQAFHRALITELLPDRRTFLFRTSAQGQTVGCLYGFIERNRALFYQGGLAHFPDNRVKPGLVSHVLAMQECSDRGLTEYDFLAGDARYKHELANAEATLIWARVKFPTTRGRVLEAGRALAGIGTR
jgi:CelD/BcsL family acetyltransferase involved in cellulose biosynthesis